MSYGGIDMKRNYTQRYLIKISVGKRIKTIFEMYVYTDERKEYLEEIIKATQKEYEFDSVYDLMDYVCDTYDMEWTDVIPDIEMELNMK